MLQKAAPVPAHPGIYRSLAYHLIKRPIVDKVTNLDAF